MQASATILHSLSAYTDEVSRISISPNGKTLAVHDDLILTLWDVETGFLLSKTEDIDDMFFEMAFSPDSEWIAAAFDEGIARIWNARTGELEKTLTFEDERMLTLAFTPDSRLLATGSESLRVWDVETGELLHTLLDPGAHQLSITAMMESYEHAAQIFTVAFSCDGKVLVSGCSDTCTVCIWDTESWTLQHTIRGYTISFSPDGKFAVVPSVEYATIKIYETSNWQLRSTLDTEGRQVAPRTFSHDGKLVATCSGHEITLWDVNSGKATKTFMDPARKVAALAFSPDGRILISCAKQCGLRVWNVKGGDCLLMLEQEDGARDRWNSNGYKHGPPAFEVLFGDGEAKVAIAFPDGSVRVWDVKWESA